MTGLKRIRSNFSSSSGNQTAGDPGGGWSSKCCSGMCVDLLSKFQDEMGFSYELARVADPKFGTFEVQYSFPNELCFCPF